jgi:hypothetical protein
MAQKHFMKNIEVLKFFFLLVVWGFELRPLHMLRLCCTLEPCLQSFCFQFFLQIRSAAFVPSGFGPQFNICLMSIQNLTCLT